MEANKTRKRKRTGRGGEVEEKQRPVRNVDYRNLINPFEPVKVYSDDHINSIHQNALRVLSDIGMKVLLPEAQTILKQAGCSHDNDFVFRFDPELVKESLTSAPNEFALAGSDEASSVTFGGKHVNWVCVGGAPHISDLDHGKRPGTLAACENIIRLNQHYDVMHLQSTNVEPQDVAPAIRHYATMRAQLLLSTKPPFLFSRGAPQVADGFELMKIARGVSDDEFRANPYTYTVINTNSPLILDKPMLQGIIDFARAGQILVITPFTLSGAMAPVTIPGALTQQHAEMLAGLTIAQLVNPGAPVVYGGFTSNVDMRSGSPAFGTPEYVRAAWATGQLARLVDLPWRSSMSCSSNCVDAQSIYESQMALWGTVFGGAHLVAHAAGWLEGGLTASMEKYIVDVEMLQQMAELMQPINIDAGDFAFEAMQEVRQGGHFFGAAHTIERFETAFYSPFLSDWSNFGQWTEAGAKTATQRANEIWKQILQDFEPPPIDVAIVEELDEFIQRRTNEGGAPPES